MMTRFRDFYGMSKDDMKIWSARAAIFVCMAGVLPAQHEFIPADALAGGTIYIANCIYCHGPEGDQIPGINLGRGKFKRASSDADLVKIIRDGIPGTGMPAQAMQERQIMLIVAYLRSLAAMPASKLPDGGNAARGRLVLEGKGACLHCHRVKDAGSRVGPDLSDIGLTRRVVEIEQSILDPDAIVLPQNRFFRLVAKDGTAHTGRILNQDSFTVQMIDGQQRLLSFSKSDLREIVAIEKSPMPSYRDKLTSQERADLLWYLASLKGV
jgi:cytochrome c oxidase cbb3-type subunit III